MGLDISLWMVAGVRLRTLPRASEHWHNGKAGASRIQRQYDELHESKVCMTFIERVSTILVCKPSSYRSFISYCHLRFVELHSVPSYELTPVIHMLGARM